MKRAIAYSFTVSLSLLRKEPRCHALFQPVFITTGSESLSPLVHTLLTVNISTADTKSMVPVQSIAARWAPSVGPGYL